MSRNNVSDNFEACYLSENGARKAFRNPQLKAIMARPDFDKCIKYMSHLIFSRNEVVLLAHGFQYEDVYSVVRTWALQFFNYETEAKTERDIYYLMMRFISQKTDTFFLFMNRKFRINESYIELHLSDLFGMSGMKTPNQFPGEVDVPATQMTEEEEQVTIQETAKERKVKIDAMRKSLNSDIGKHSARLAELSTSKVVDFQVRKKARQMCKKHNIDYIAWAKAQIKSRNLNEADFILV